MADFLLCVHSTKRFRFYCNTPWPLCAHPPKGGLNCGGKNNYSYIQ